MSSTTKRLSAQILETVIMGRMTEKDAVQFMEAGLRHMPTPFWVIDGTNCGSYSPSAIDVVGKLMLKCKESGLKHVIAIVPSSMLRMVVALVRMATKMDIHGVANKTEAEKLIASLKTL